MKPLQRAIAMTSATTANRSDLLVILFCKENIVQRIFITPEQTRHIGSATLIYHPMRLLSGLFNGPLMPLAFASP